MPSLTEYFERTTYKPKYEFGSRVFGRWNKIPFVGTLYTDTVISLEQGPRLSIHLDLPIKFENRIYNIIIDTHDKFKGLSELIDPDAPVAERKARASKTQGNGFESHLAHQPKTKTKTQSLLEKLQKLQKPTTKK